MRASLQAPRAVHPGYASPARADLGDVDCGHPQYVPRAAQQAVAGVHAAPDLVLGREEHLAALDDRRLGGRAAHVEGHQIPLVQPTAQVEGPNDARGGAGLDAVHGLFGGDLQRV